MSEYSFNNKDKAKVNEEERRSGLDLFSCKGMLAASEGLETLRYSSDLTPLRPVAKSCGLKPIGIVFKSQMEAFEGGCDSAGMEKDHDEEMQSPGLPVIPCLSDRFCKRGVI